MRVIITDNETQFNNVKFKEFYQFYEVKLKFNLVSYTQTNGLIKVTNQDILEKLKKWVIRVKGT